MFDDESNVEFVYCFCYVLVVVVEFVFVDNGVFGWFGGVMKRKLGVEFEVFDELVERLRGENGSWEIFECWFCFGWESFVDIVVDLGFVGFYVGFVVEVKEFVEFGGLGFDFGVGGGVVDEIIGEVVEGVFGELLVICWVRWEGGVDL